MQETMITLVPALWGTIAGLLANTLQRIPHEFKSPRKSERWELPLFLLLGGILGLALPLGPALPQGAILWNITLGILLTLILTVSWEDIHHQIAPDFLTIGGGCLLSTLMAIQAIANTLPVITWKHIGLGLLAGPGALLLITFLGKTFLGKKVTSFEEPEGFEINKTAKTLTMGGESYNLDIFFQEGNGTMEMMSPEGDLLVTILNSNGDTIPNNPPTDRPCNKILTPRDVLGLGDVKFMMGIGAVLGPTGALFAIFSGCLLGAIGGIPLALKNGRIPLAPFLGAGALLYLWKGTAILTLMGWN